MTIREKVAQAIQFPDRGRAASIKANAIAGIAITAFLEAAAEDGWHMHPDKATREMVNSASKAGYHSSDSDEWSDRELAREYRAMLADPTAEFEWDK